MLYFIELCACVILFPIALTVVAIFSAILLNLSSGILHRIKTGLTLFKDEIKKGMEK